MIRQGVFKKCKMGNSNSRSIIASPPLPAHREGWGTRIFFIHGENRSVNPRVRSAWLSVKLADVAAKAGGFV